MKCPHCEYEHKEKDTFIKEGFYELSNDNNINCYMEGRNDKKTLLGCPECNKLFMG